jgi:hypothetical protein
MEAAKIVIIKELNIVREYLIKSKFEDIQSITVLLKKARVITQNA